MPLMIFSFAFDTDSKQVALGGNIDPQVALQILQQIVVASLVEKAKGDGAKPPETSPGGQGSQVKAKQVENPTEGAGIGQI